MTNLITVNKYKTNRLADYTKLMHKNCPFCGSEMLSVFRNNPQIDRCASCGQAFRQEMVRDVISEYVDKSPMPSWLESRAASRHHYGFIQYTIGLENISNILEIGSGDGVLLRLIRKNHPNINITALEPNKNHCAILSLIPDVTVIQDYMENAGLKQKYDLVIMSHVLEHIENPQEAIKYIYDNLLVDGGFLYIDVPNQDYELCSVGISFKAPATHLYFFNGENMKNMLTSLGFDSKQYYGVKYKTLPWSYPKIFGWIGKLEESKKYKYTMYGLKAINKISIYTTLFFRNLFDTRPSEIPIDRVDSRYNNIAIAVRK